MTVRPIKRFLYTQAAQVSLKNVQTEWLGAENDEAGRASIAGTIASGASRHPQLRHDRTHPETFLPSDMQHIVNTPAARLGHGGACMRGSSQH